MTAKELQELFDSMAVKRSRQDEINARIIAIDGKSGNTSEIDKLNREFMQIERECALIQNLVTAGQTPLTAQERKTAEVLVTVVRSIVAGKAVQETGLRIENNTIYLERAEQVSTSTDVNAIQPDSIHELIEPLQKALLIDKLGCKINTGIVGTRKYPSVNNVVATLEGETTKLIGQKVAYTATTATPKRVGVSIPFSLMALHQANIDLIGYAFRLCGVASSQLLNAWMFATAKINEKASNGCFVTAAAAPVFTLTTEKLSESHVIDLETKVLSTNITNDETAAYVASVAAYGELKKMRDPNTGEKIMQNGLLNGYPVLVSNHVENKAGVKGLGFGIFSNVEVNQYGPVSIMVDNLSRSSEGIVEVNFNAMYDIEVIRTEAFAYGTFKDATTSSPIVVNTGVA